MQQPTWQSNQYAPGLPASRVTLLLLEHAGDLCLDELGGLAGTGNEQPVEGHHGEAARGLVAEAVLEGDQLGVLLLAGDLEHRQQRTLRHHPPAALLVAQLPQQVQVRLRHHQVAAECRTTRLHCSRPCLETTQLLDSFPSLPALFIVLPNHSPRPKRFMFP